MTPDMMTDMKPDMTLDMMPYMKPDMTLEMTLLNDGWSLQKKPTNGQNKTGSRYMMLGQENKYWGRIIFGIST